MSLFSKTFKVRSSRFARDTEGSMSVEAVIIMPLLFWFFVASYVWFDSFQAQNTNLKAAYTVADMISRETAPVNDTYMNGLNTILDFLTHSNQPTSVRVTSVRCAENCDSDQSRVMEMCWSWASAEKSPHTDGTLTSVYDQVPLMAEGDTVLLTETFMTYEPAFEAGLSTFEFDNFIVTRPRFAAEVVYGTEQCY